MDSSQQSVKHKIRVFIGSVALISAPIFIGMSAHAETEEQHLVRIAQMLKPISDTQWNEIAGPRSTETYEIQRGDNLWDISKRLFGNHY